MNAPLSAREIVAALVARARAAQRVYDGWTQAQVDEVVTACGWAIVEPNRNRILAELAVRDSGLGNVPDKIAKNHRKTMGLLRDLQGAKSVGVISEDPALGIVEIARPVGVVAAITPSTNPGATPANKIINALKGRNAVILAPSPKGASTCAKLLEFIHAELDKVGAPRDLVQMLPDPVTKDTTLELMRQADLIAATGSQANIRAAYSSGTPAIGVGAGNVVSIVDASADLDDAAQKIARSKTFDNATSCSSENSVVLLDAVYDAALAALARAGGVMLDAQEKATLQRTMWPERQALGRGHRAIGAGRRAARGTVAPRRARRALPDGRGERYGPRASVLGRKALAGARRLPCAGFRCGGRDHRAPCTTTRARATRWACIRATTRRRFASATNCPSRASS